MTSRRRSRISTTPPKRGHYCGYSDSDSDTEIKAIAHDENKTDDRIKEWMAAATPAPDAVTQSKSKLAIESIQIHKREKDNRDEKDNDDDIHNNDDDIHNNDDDKDNNDDDANETNDIKQNKDASKKVAEVVSKETVEHAFRCPICIEVLAAPLILTCGHSACFSCLYSSNGLNIERCPLCKSAIDERTIVDGYVLSSAIEALTGTPALSYSVLRKQNPVQISLASIHKFQTMLAERSTRAEYDKCKAFVVKNLKPKDEFMLWQIRDPSTDIALLKEMFFEDGMRVFFSGQLGDAGLTDSGAGSIVILLR